MNKVSIYGGLGNQMFQYAFVSFLNSHGVPCRISVRDFFLYNHHNGFELSRAFELELSTVEKLKLKVLESGSFLWGNSFIRKGLSYLFYFNAYLFETKISESKEFVYDSNVLDVSNVRLVGTWQSVKYLEGHDAVLKAKFRFKKPSDLVNINLAEEIIQNNSVAVHIRRGDYTSVEWRNSHMVIDGTDYYMKAIDELSKKLVSPVFYFFSDDIQWVKANFKASNFKFVSHNSGSNSYLDMYLMSLCSNFVIANSTFSWWAAWLSSNPEKDIYMPNQWIKGLNTSEIYPDKCIILPA